MSTKMIRSLISFYATPDRPTQDEQLAAAARVLADRKAAEDKIDIKEHVRRYHGGHLEPGESCPFLEKIKAAEEEFCTLDPKDADGDGNPDFAEEEAKEESEAEVSEDSAVDQYLSGIESASVTEEPHSEHCDSCGSATEHFVRGISKKYPNASFREFRKHNLPFYRIVIEGKEYTPAITRDFSDRYRVYDSDGKELFRCNFPDTAEKMASYGEGFSETLKMEGDSAWTDNGIKSRLRNVVARKNPDFDDAAIRSYFKAVAKDDFKEEDHPRAQKGGEGGGRFTKKPETMRREDNRDLLSKSESKNILLVGLERDTDSKLNDMLGDTKVIPVHHTISDVGLEDAIAESRRSGRPIVAQAISEWRKVCKELLAKELEKGGFTCIAYAGKCPCGQVGSKCRCTNSQIDRYNSIALNRDELGKVFKIVDVGEHSEEK